MQHSCVVLRSHFWLRKASDPKGRNVGTVTIACSPSIDSVKTCLPFKWRVPSRYNCQFHYLPFEPMSLRSQKWLRRTMQVAASICQQSNYSTLFFGSFDEAISGFAKIGRKILDRANTAWGPSLMNMLSPALKVLALPINSHIWFRTFRSPLKTTPTLKILTSIVSVPGLALFFLKAANRFLNLRNFPSLLQLFCLVTDWEYIKYGRFQFSKSLISIWR